MPPPSIPPGLPSPSSDEINSCKNNTQARCRRVDCGGQAPVNRAPRAAESGAVSLRVKGRGFTQATLVDNPALCPQSPAM